MKKILSAIFFIGISSALPAQQLPTAYTTDFTVAGYKGDIPNSAGSTLTLDRTGATDCATAINNAISSAATPTTIYLPAGTYLLRNTITLKSGVVLRGEGSDKTQLNIDISSGSYNLVNMKGSSPSAGATLTVNASRGATNISLSNVSNISTGTVLQIFQTPALLAYDSWAETNNFLQVVHVKSVAGNIVTLNEPLRFSYTTALNAMVRRITPLKESGLEDFKIVCTSKYFSGDTPVNDNIAIDYADNCWIIGVESDHCNGAHIDLRRSSNIQISGCYFHHGYDYGGGGSAYGVCLTGGAGQVLVANCIFDSLRHAMLIQAFSSGNVFAYNYSYRVHRTDLTPADKPGDLVLHGNYPHSNLFQGNIGNSLFIDNPHGANGPRNVFLRNRLSLYGINIEDQRTTTRAVEQKNAGIQNDSTVLIANEITHSAGSGYGAYSIFSGSKGNLQVANLKQAVVTPSGTDASNYKSFYSQHQPLFWDISDSWYGIGSTYNSTGIPAKTRMESGASKKTHSLKKVFDMSPATLTPPKSAPPIVESSTSYCKGAIAAPLSATGVNLKWYVSLTATTFTTQAPTPSTANAGTYTYYVTQTESGKTESDKAVIQVIINDCTPPVPPTPDPAVITKNNISLTLNSITHTFSINARGLGNIKVYTLGGQLVFQAAIDQTGSFSLPDGQSGQYIVQVSTTDGREASFKVWL